MGGKFVRFDQVAAGAGMGVSKDGSGEDEEGSGEAHVACLLALKIDEASDSWDYCESVGLSWRGSFAVGSGLDFGNCLSTCAVDAVFYGACSTQWCDQSHSTNDDGRRWLQGASIHSLVAKRMAAWL